MKTSGILLLVLLSTTAVHADDLTKMIQEDLTTLGYDAGDATGEATVKTAIAISQFQAEYDLEVTGESSPQLAGIIKSKMGKTSKPATTTPAQPAMAASMTAASAPSPAELEAAQRQCLADQYAKAQESQKKKRGFGSLVSAVTRTVAQTGNSQTAAEIHKASSDVYNANATATDLSSAAKDLGLTEDQVEACRNPQ